MSDKDQVSQGLIKTTQNVAKALESFTTAADKRASSFLMGFGSFLIVLSVLQKVQLFGLKLSALQPSEFISLVISGALFIVLGALMRLYMESKELKMKRENQQAGITIINKTLGIAEDMNKVEETKQGGV